MSRSILPSWKPCTAVCKIHNPTVLINVQRIGEPKSNFIHFFCKWASQSTIWAYNKEAHICVRNVEITRLFIEAQAQWPPTNVLRLSVIMRTFTTIPTYRNSIIRIIDKIFYFNIIGNI